MNYGIYFDKYESELALYLIFGDEGRKKIFKVKERSMFLHLEVRGDNWKYLYSFDKEFGLLEDNMSGVDLKVLYNDLIEKGVKVVCE